MDGKFDRLKRIVEHIEPDVEKFYGKKNKTAGTRVRKAMQEIKLIAQELRMEILKEVKKGR